MKAARGILFVLSRIAIVVVVIVLIVVAFYTAMNTMNIRMVAKDAFTQRATAVLMDDEDGTHAELMKRFFTNRFMSNDTLLYGSAYRDFTITNYYQRTDVGDTIVWPWETRVTIDVEDLVTDIVGDKVVGETETDEQKQAATEEKPPEWQNGTYAVTMVKDDDTWKVDSMKFVKEAEPVATVSQKAKESASPSAGVSASASPTAE